MMNHQWQSFGKRFPIGWLAFAGLAVGVCFVLWVVNVSPVAN